VYGLTTRSDQPADIKELAELRAVEGELDVDDPRGDAYAEAITLLEWQLRQAAKKTGTIRDLGNDYVPVADDGLLRYSAPWGGPVVDAWRKTLTPVDDLNTVLRLRRVRRIIRDYPLDQVREAYRDGEGRYVLVIELSAGPWSLAEWPVSLQATSSWTDKTVLAGDDELGTVTTLLALTPTDDGQMHVDPVPLPPRSHRDGSPTATAAAPRAPPTRRCCAARRRPHHLMVVHPQGPLTRPPDPSTDRPSTQAARSRVSKSMSASCASKLISWRRISA
ncbi:MAG: hypothetical protein ACRDTT_24010, partial [Pseudonocardiaceae bacterium]